MAIEKGDKVPEGSFKHMTAEGMQDLSSDELFGNKKVVLFSVPGAFTPTCSNEHLPSYLRHHDEIKSSGFDIIACMAVNDAFVMDAWGKDRGVDDKILMLADGNAEYTKKLGLELDASGFGLGIRSKRFSMIVRDGVVETVNVDEGAYDLTSAEKTCSIG